MEIYEKNLIECSIYLAVRKCIEYKWLNDRDQYLIPDDSWKNDTEFHNDCLTYTIYNNNIKSSSGINHWIPYSASEVNAKSNFESSFMHDYINGKTYDFQETNLFTESKTKKKKELKFSNEAKDVFKAGKKLWQYYHSQPTANVNASYYDIREFFQGCDDDSGKMNNKSGDDKYNELIGDLRSAIKDLALKIQPKVYKYGFLLE